METYREIYTFLRLHTDVVELFVPGGKGRVIVAPELSARVMTSTIDGYDGASLGWINREAFVSDPDPKFRNYGAEERLWLGPEGGQFSLYFKPGTDFDLKNWFVPPVFNSDPYAVIDKSETSIDMCKNMMLSNWSGTSFSVTVERSVKLFPLTKIKTILNAVIADGITSLGYETQNAILNRSEEPITKEKGLLSIWLLGMLNASERTAVIIPYRSDSEGGKGEILKDDYFGKVPSDRLVVTKNCVVFRGDAKCRSKIGLNPLRALDRLGSLDLDSGLLTVILFDFHGDQDYVNSAWEIQAEPFSGDVVNSYNDGPPKGGGKGLGHFYELESSSPARELGPGERLEHCQKIFHFKGNIKALDKLAIQILGAGKKEAELLL